MLIKGKKFLQFLNLFLLISIVGYFIYSSINQPKTVVVDSQKLFDGFTMTKEMKRIGEKAFDARKAILDSIYVRIQSPSISQNDKQTLMQQLLSGKQDLENFNQEYATGESLKIWSRIQTYAGDFAKEKKYSLIMASQSGRNVLYSEEENDVTQDFIQFLNKKYEGIK